MAASGRLGEAGMERAVHTIVTYAHYCRATGLAADQVSALATSAIREAANRDEFLARAREAYLILNAGLPGFTPREVALIAQAARYHRKGSPGLDDLSALGRDGVGRDLD